MDRIPCLLVGDGPQELTGLGRIARDIGWLVARHEDVPLDLLSVGGSVPPCWHAWPHIPMGSVERGDDWGAAFVRALWKDRWGQTPGVLWVVWDPARLYAYHDIELPVQKWCYTAVDSHNRWGGLSGPPGAALQAFDRVLAYGRWGADVIKATRGENVRYLPHGLWLDTYQTVTPKEDAWVTEQLGPYLGQDDVLIGCVCTNQHRKDLALFFETLATLRDRGKKVHAWLHTDQLVGAWSVTQLVEDCGLQKKVTVTIGARTDRQLSCLYQRCDLTIAPGLGEGFGYPIVESLAAGVPVVHGDFGGGSELVPKSEWRVPMREYRTESVYALRRPVFRAEDVANAVERVLRWKAAVGDATARAYCQGSVAHLDWEALSPRWVSWIREGLR